MSLPLRAGNLNFLLEQWERVQRWRERCLIGSYELDYYEAFFINAYHLRDWIEQWLVKNNKEDALLQLKQDFNAIQYLKILKDVCNGCKHFTLVRKAEIGKQFAIIYEYDPWGNKLVILIGGIKYLLDDLFNEVYNYWENFMKKHGLDSLKEDFRGPAFPFD
ncbi:MAG TPA: hypothetical protein VHA13_01800 [Gammaproteobacteria bacterium]|nr:hypothetical protein [Gammaproteobacteria bacterium]